MSRTIRKIKYAKCLRLPKTFGEIRDSEACKADGVYKRKKRNKRHLPSDHDDLVVAAAYEKIQK